MNGKRMSQVSALSLDQLPKDGPIMIRHQQRKKSDFLRAGGLRRWDLCSQASTLQFSSAVCRFQRPAKQSLHNLANFGRSQSTFAALSTKTPPAERAIV